MKQTLLWDECPGEVRAGLLEDGKLVELRIFRPQASSLLPTTIYTARIKQRLGGGKAIVDLGSLIEAQLENAPDKPEGHLLAVELVRSAIPEPGRWKLPLVRTAPDVLAQSTVGLHPEQEPRKWFVARMLESVDEVVCANANVARDLRSDIADEGLRISIDPERIEQADLDSLVESAVSGEFAIDGGVVSIERTRAMTMIDIDGSGDPVALNLAAAREIPRLLRLLDIGGQVGIDFLAMPDRAARQNLDSALATACVHLGPHERTAANGFGFVQIIRPRSGASVLEILCGITPGRLSVESKAVALLRAATRSHGHGKRCMVSSPAVIERLQAWPSEIEKLRKTLGREIELVPDSSVPGYGHVHVSQT